MVCNNKIYCFHQGSSGQRLFKFRIWPCQNHSPLSSTAAKFIVSATAAQIAASFGTTSSMGAVGLVMLKFPTLLCPRPLQRSLRSSRKFTTTNKEE